MGDDCNTDPAAGILDRTTTNFFTGSPLNALTTLSFSENIDLQRSAALAFAEITEKEVRQVGRDTLDPILFLLSSHDTEVQRAASAALGNLAVNTENKLLIVRLGGLEPLIRQMLSPNVEVQCNAVGCVTNLATHDENKTKIAKSGALVPLTRLARSKDMRVQRNATGALLNMTHSDENRQQLVNAGAIPVLVSLLNSPDTDVQYYCTTALSNIAVDAVNRKKLAQSEPKLVQSLVALMDSPSLKVQCQAALALRNLASDDELKPQLLEMGICEVLIPLTNSPSVEVQGNSAAALGNLSSKDGRSPSDDYSAFNEVWDKPDGGLHAYLYRFLSSADATFQHIAVWTIVQLLESGDEQLIRNIRDSPRLQPYIHQLAQSQPTTPSSVGSRSHSYSESGGEGGTGEITALARRILELTEGESGTHPMGTPAGGAEDELRKSVREAFAGQAE
ncbi:Vacuolar protein 8, partial [Tulasnella sp. 408]